MSRKEYPADDSKKHLEMTNRDQHNTDSGYNSLLAIIRDYVDEEKRALPLMSLLGRPRHAEETSSLSLNKMRNMIQWPPTQQASSPLAVPAYEKARYLRAGVHLQLVEPDEHHQQTKGG
ncbi:hypothetical protein C0Q70_09955 [Pomacea canaliculata]|uniref:Uncharacterized protein n=1 Tax=Pomacea canaliculata TaxID=400727 RepID=A0A2T7PB95_POMCA|nr:hypothetical protein C0Q70_09955 [Pomacea canaliculata]